MGVSLGWCDVHHVHPLSAPSHPLASFTLTRTIKGPAGSDATEIRLDRELDEASRQITSVERVERRVATEAYNPGSWIENPGPEGDSARA